jgi:hypothetical protein
MSDETTEASTQASKQRAKDLETEVLVDLPEEHKAKFIEDQAANQPDENFGLAETHAIRNPGHSVVTILSLDIKEDGSAGTVLMIACNGSPDKFMNDERDCIWHTIVPIP